MSSTKSLKFIFDLIQKNSKLLEILTLDASPSISNFEESKNYITNTITLDDINKSKEFYSHNNSDSKLSEPALNQLYDYIVVHASPELINSAPHAIPKIISHLKENGNLFFISSNSNYIGFVGNLIAGEFNENQNRYSKNFINQFLIENKIYPANVYGIPERIDDYNINNTRKLNLKNLISFYRNDEDAWVNNWIFQSQKTPLATKIASAHPSEHNLEIKLFGHFLEGEGYTYIGSSHVDANEYCDTYFKIPESIATYIDSLHFVAPLGCDKVFIKEVKKIQKNSQLINLKESFSETSSHEINLVDNKQFLEIQTTSFDSYWSGGLSVSLRVDKCGTKHDSDLFGNTNSKNIEFRKIDIIIPIFNAFFDLVDCIESVLLNTRNINYRIIAINDGSSDFRIKNYLESLRNKIKQDNFLVIENSENLGFIKSVNKGIVIDNYSDVVLLNSDTIVTNNWLAEIINTSNQDIKIGTVTPFSNNGSIASFPVPNKNNLPESMPEIDKILDVMSRLKDLLAPDLPTGVGFCYFVRRRLINQIGVFDEVFGKGYGEENDFSIRAKKAGWRNVLCPTSFVIHKGSKSFGNEEKIRISRKKNLNILINKHPEYSRDLKNFIQNDPLKSYRNLLINFISKKSITGRKILHILHPLGGGTERHVDDVINGINKDYLHAKGIISKNSILIDDYSSGIFSSFQKTNDESWEEFISGICIFLNISIIHVHHVMGNRRGIIDGVRMAKFKYLVTIHDGYLWCPNTSFIHSDKKMFCDVEQNQAVCGSCEKFDPFEWRKSSLSFLRGAEFVVSPSKWNTSWIKKCFPGVAVETIPHGIKASSHTKIKKQKNIFNTIKVAVIGGIGQAKGADIILKLVDLTHTKNLPIEWIIIGSFSPRNKLKTYPEKLLKIHGKYHYKDLPNIINEYDPSLIFYPGPKPENYCYTLSEAMPSGVPFLVNPHGAVAERVIENKAGWTFEDINNVDEILKQIIFITSSENKNSYDAFSSNCLNYDGLTELENMLGKLTKIYSNISTNYQYSSTQFTNQRALDSFKQNRPVSNYEDSHLPEWISPSIQKKRLIWSQNNINYDNDQMKSEHPTG